MKNSKNILIVLIALFSYQHAQCQVDSLKKNTIYIEYLGQPGPSSSYPTNNVFTSGHFTLKYDRLILHQNKSMINLNIGFTYLDVYGGCTDTRYGMIITPLIINYFYGKNRNYVGLGLIYFPYFSNYKKFDGYFSLNVEDRLYLGKKRNIFASINLKLIEINFETEGCYKRGVFPIPGFGVGYSF